MGLNEVGRRVIGKFITFSAICDTDSKLNSNLCAKYLSGTAGLYANP